MSDQQRSQGQFLGVGFASGLSGVHVREPIQPTPEEIAEWRKKDEEKRKAYEEHQRKEHRKQLRDAFAMAALTGLLSDPGCGEVSACAVSNTAYEYADAMMKARGDE